MKSKVWWRYGYTLEKHLLDILLILEPENFLSPWFQVIINYILLVIVSKTSNGRKRFLYGSLRSIHTINRCKITWILWFFRSQIINRDNQTRWWWVRGPYPTTNNFATVQFFFLMRACCSTHLTLSRREKASLQNYNFLWTSLS